MSIYCRATFRQTGVVVDDAAVLLLFFLHWLTSAPHLSADTLKRLITVSNSLITTSVLSSFKTPTISSDVTDILGKNDKKKRLREKIYNISQRVIVYFLFFPDVSELSEFTSRERMDTMISSVPPLSVNSSQVRHLPSSTVSRKSSGAASPI